MKQGILIAGKQYHVWKEGEYLGVATWAEDSDNGEVFLQCAEENGEPTRIIIPADEWELL